MINLQETVYILRGPKKPNPSKPLHQIMMTLQKKKVVSSTIWINKNSQAEDKGKGPTLSQTYRNDVRAGFKLHVTYLSGTLLCRRWRGEVVMA